jgi:hypothetical protein
LEQLHTQLILEIADLPAQGRLRYMEFLRCRARDVFHLGNGHEVA